ncbi:Vmh family MBL fold metallo-hydrolase [Acinetobacter guillouiae]|jgi:glyoxylase-like metal-dependent hydrolase (beta-lactamase superfamily II)|uniref:Vmh family MBL fold metallo-hydrolase n=1 Tax=Acinetobacter TaxID=469 RepID=UPI00141B83AF|nr:MULTISPECIES: Vmh family MBL fold metallo-hydrolase [Acinetobacter]MCS4298060.1 glyoxylase-like metal-dependent hydrolase (beta-lactamase superfamily II) [Acinetobacter guillouiae]MCT9979824.1 Vmh family MBL fold metallo-hydrolase [Acinetobacter sp. I-MWF]MCW2251664.1 glyoxylase-like metal-dependent hydrolase (beta-lactamase superfamily II) [Acinetobacter sp. BIGb0204]NII35839.1 glyoxylase-like metal-dependent hydrolase (beta-lactamase superfamily II) [Acinetobacter sp. BIGb0196]
MKLFLKSLLASSVMLSASAFAAELSYKVYNPQAQGIFPVTSTLISGEKDAVLVDAQFSVNDAKNLVKIIQDSGKNLKYIVITAGDPDFYFGLEPLVQAFPDAKVIATPEVVKHIEATKEGKFAYWGPILKNGAPSQVIVPSASEDKTIVLEGEKIEIKSPGKYASYLWVPSNRTILGGVGLSSGIHLWTADAQTEKERNEWRKTLKQMNRLNPRAVIPGHYIGDIPTGTQAIDFTYQYLVDVDQVLKDHKDSASVIAALKEKYPNLAEESSLELSSKVLTGEMEWK